MKIIATHPGKIGDLLWALPTVRLIAEKFGEKITLVVPPGLAGIGELVKLQAYIADVVVDALWEVQDTAPRTPRIPPPGYVDGFRLAAGDRILHLGYHAWPKEQLARETYSIACIEGELSPLDLERPWIEAPTEEQAKDKLAGTEFGEVSVGFTDEWGELKLGVLASVACQHFGLRYNAADFELLAAAGTRWFRELGPALSAENVYEHRCEDKGADWVWTAYVISQTKVFLGCLSSQAVLAKALGKPRVLVEPNPHRHHPIFQHPDQGLVKGNDGLPTFDARHVAEALKEKLDAIG